jgi:hypothetical protein
LRAAGKERIEILLVLDITSDRCKHEGTRIYSLQITSWHLQHNRVRCWHHRNNSGTTFDSSTPLVLLGLVQGDFKIWRL